MAIDERQVQPPSSDAPAGSSSRADEAANKLARQRKRTYGIGFLKGLAVTFKHVFKHNTVIEYPDVKQDLAPRTRGVIALKEENCTVCMLCSRECPDWCIYIDSHKETLPPKRQGGRPRKRNVLDRFAIDFALCMYCGICVEVCPYDALFWSREFEYSEFDITQLTHEKERLSDWMATVLPPPPLEEGAELPGSPAAAGTPAVAAGAAGPGSAQRPSPPAAATAAAQRPEQAARAPAAAATAAPPVEKASDSQQQAGETKDSQPEGRAQATEEKADTLAEARPTGSKGPDTAQPEAIRSEAETRSPDQISKRGEAEPDGKDRPAEAAGPSTGDATGTKEAPSTAAAQAQVPNVQVPEVQKGQALDPSEDPEEVYRRVLDEQIAKGSSPQVAEARAKVARVKAERGIKRGPTPIETDKLVPSAPTKGQPQPQEPAGAPEAKDIQPDPGPVAPAAGEETAPAATAETAAPAEEQPKAEAPATDEPKAATPADPPAAAPGDENDPEAVYRRVLEEERAKGSSDTVAQARAKAARVRAERAKG